VDYFLGQIALFPFGFAPIGWMSCQGQILNISQYSALYSLIGAQFGGNGSSTFGLPNLLNASPQTGMQFYICTSGIYPSRS
jgi:microcystin-dependent protein